MKTGTRFVLSALLVSHGLLGQAVVNSFVAPISIASGARSNAAETPTTVWTETVQVPGATSLRLHFDAAELAGVHDAIVVMNPLDGQVHRLDQRRLKEWRNSTGWFNGNVVNVALELGAHSQGTVSIDSAQVQAAPLLPENVCGSDDRVLSFDNRVCRLMIASSQGSFICTGWLINDHATYLTAGHCFDGLTNVSVVGEINVPLSTPGGSILHPGILDQFPGDDTVTQFNAGGDGDDWAVGRLHPNTAGTNMALFNGWFDIIPTIPQFFTARLTGYGNDTSPTPERNNVQQTSADGASLPTVGSHLILHNADSDHGASGGPLIINGTSLTAGIHTTGACSFFTSNRGTSFNNGSLMSAINAVGGCAGVFLVDGGTPLVTCSDTIYSCAPVAGKWNVVGVSSQSDWDIFRENVGSAFGGNTCDFLLANGHVGTVPPISGSLHRFSGSATAHAQFRSATPITIGQTAVQPWTNGDILRAFEFQVTTPGNYDITMTGDPSLSWHLYSPGAGTGWWQRTTSLISAGSANTGTVPTFPLSPGFYCIIVYRDGDAASVTPSNIALTVVPTGTTLALPANTPQTIAGQFQDFVLTPTASFWNGVALAGQNDWSLLLGSTGGVNQGVITEFGVANGHNGAVFPTTGTAVRQGGAAPGTIEFAPAVQLGNGGLVVTTLPAGHVIKMHEVITFVPLTEDFLITGDPSLKWFIFAPGTTAGWIGRNQAIASGIVGDAGTTITLQPGAYAIAIVHDGPPSTTDLPYSLAALASSSHLTLAGPGASVAVNSPAYTFSMVPSASRWNAVGIYSGNGITAGGWGVSMGAAQSFVGAGTSVLVANGHLGTIAPTNGILQGTGILGSMSGTLHESNVITMTPGTPSSATLSPFPAVYTFEFNVTTPGPYDLGVTGPSGFAWSLFRPGASAAWRPLAQADLSAGFGTQSSVPLQAGWHAIVVRRGTGFTVSGTTATVSVTPVANPAPSLTSVTPTSVLANAGATTITLAGSGFNAFSDVRWDVTTSLAVTSVTPTAITLTLPASLLASPGVHSIRVQNPAPGGGISSTSTFTVNAAVPILAMVSPSGTIAGGPATNVDIFMDGTTPVFPGAVARWNGAPIPTLMVNSLHLVVTISASQLAVPGTGAITVTAPAPGGGTSAASSFDVTAPRITAATPTTLPVMTLASPPVTLSITGLAFLPSSVVHAGIATLPTTFIDSAHLTCQVGPGVPETRGAGAVALVVENGHFAVSNTFAVPVGPGGNNVGTVIRYPLDPLPNESYAAVIEGGPVGAPFALIVDFAAPAPVFHWPDLTANLVLGVGTPGATLPILDGIGVFGPPNPAAILGSNPLTNPPTGKFTLPGFVRPSAPLNVTFTMQVAYLDATAPGGFKLGWPRIETL